MTAGVELIHLKKTIQIRTITIRRLCALLCRCHFRKLPSSLCRSQKYDVVALIYFTSPRPHCATALISSNVGQLHMAYIRVFPYRGVSFILRDWGTALNCWLVLMWEAASNYWLTQQGRSVRVWRLMEVEQANKESFVKHVQENTPRIYPASVSGPFIIIIGV